MVEEENEKILFVWGEPLTTQVLAAIEAWTGIQDKKKLLVIGCQIGNQFQKHIYTEKATKEKADKHSSKYKR